MLGKRRIYRGGEIPRRATVAGLGALPNASLDVNENVGFGCRKFDLSNH